MVATRNHPRDFKAPPENESPRKRTTRASTAASEVKREIKEEPKEEPRARSPASPPPSAFSRTARYVSSAPTRRAGAWSHTPSNLTLLWLAVSLPLVIWDTAYILLRPHTLPGGALHKLLWGPYELYGQVDFVYSAAAYHSGLGFTAAQGTMNAFETAAYLVYLYMVYAYGRPEARQGTGAPDKSWAGKLAESRTLYGRTAVVAVLLNYTTLIITLSKSVLYCTFCWTHTHSVLGVVQSSHDIRVQRSIRRLVRVPQQRSAKDSIHLRDTQVGIPTYGLSYMDLQ